MAGQRWGGEVEDLSGTERSGTVSDAVLRFIDLHPEGVKAGDITTAVVAAGSAPSTGSVYNVLSKLAARGRVRRSEGVYFPLNEKGLPEGSPETGDGETSPNEDQDGNLPL